MKFLLAVSMVHYFVAFIYGIDAFISYRKAIIFEELSWVADFIELRNVSLFVIYVDI